MAWKCILNEHKKHGNFNHFPFYRVALKIRIKIYNERIRLAKMNWNWKIEMPFIVGYLQRTSVAYANANQKLMIKFCSVLISCDFVFTQKVRVVPAAATVVTKFCRFDGVCKRVTVEVYRNKLNMKISWHDCHTGWLGVVEFYFTAPSRLIVEICQLRVTVK